MKLAIFDCDGTLVDGQAEVCDAMARAFAALDLPAPERGAVRRMVGLSLPVAIAQLAPDCDEAARGALVAAYKRAFFERRRSGLLAEPLFDGIAELIEELHRDGWQLAIATGKSRRGLDACLKTHGLTGYFASLQTADGHPSKPDPAMVLAALEETGASSGRSVMIGDTSFDMAMARAAGVRAIGVAWGYHGIEELRAAGAERIALTVDQLGKYL